MEKAERPPHLLGPSYLPYGSIKISCSPYFTLGRFLFAITLAIVLYLQHCLWAHFDPGCLLSHHWDSYHLCCPPFPVGRTLAYPFPMSGPLFNIYVHHLIPHEKPVKGKRVEIVCPRNTAGERPGEDPGWPDSKGCMPHLLLLLLSYHLPFCLLRHSHSSRCSAPRLRGISQEKSWGAPSSWCLYGLITPLERHLQQVWGGR